MFTCASLILGLHLASYHVTERWHQNNINPGAYVECNGWTAGVYRNSLSRTSVYAGHTFRSGPFALALGVVSGYKKQYGMCGPGLYDRPDNRCYLGASDSAVIPMLAPSVNLGPARIWYLPRVGDTSSVIHLSVEKEFT